MVPAEQIVRAAIEHKVDFIGLSGLITPSLEEMCRVARELREAGVSVPLMIGGATTSPLHTALKTAPLYDGPVFHVKDAAQNPVLAMQLLGEERVKVIQALKEEQQRLREEHGAPKPKATVGERLTIDWSQEQLPVPTYTGVKEFDITAQQVREYINWRHFYNLWRVEEGSTEAMKIRAEAEALLDGMSHGLRARVGFFAARGTESAIVLSHNKGCACCHPQHETRLTTPRQHTPNVDGVTLALCDFVAPEGDYVGAFALTVAQSFAQELSLLKEQGKEYEALLLQSVGDRLVEAASEWLHERVRRELWGYAPQEQLSVKEMFQARYRGIRPAVGYPSLPDQRLIFPLAELLDVEKIGISLTENGAMYPQSSVCGLYLASPHARYFVIE
jgi:5-methyltetrahydrofolate--homocysteine methyltransferase